MLPLVTFFHLIVLWFNPLILAAPADQEGRSTLQLNDVPLVSTLAQPRSSLSTSPGSLLQLNSTGNLSKGCFHPLPFEYKAAKAEDCNVIIENIILRYPDPFAELSWGYSDNQDINLTLEQNRRWRWGECLIFVRGPDKRLVDRFRIVDVAARAKDLITECVVGTKEGFGGFSDIGHLPTTTSFYVVVAGPDDDLANFTVISPPTNDTTTSASLNKTVLSLSRNTERSID